MKAKKHWYNYLWIWSIVYFCLGFFNILFAWLGMIDFLLPLAIAVFGRNKWYCNHLCGRGQLFSLLGGKLKLSLNHPTPRLFYNKWFRYGFLIFFMAMFMNMIYQTWLVAGGAHSLRETIQLFWSIQVPWSWTYTAGTTIPWIAQFSFGFYGLMLTSLILGILFMLLFRPRSWCAFCPMGSMTQVICQLENRKARKEKESSEGEKKYWRIIWQTESAGMRLRTGKKYSSAFPPAIFRFICRRPKQQEKMDRLLSIF